MTITALEPQKRNTDRLNVFLDGEFAFGVGVDVAAELGLRVGKTLTEEEIDTVKEADAFRQAYDRAVGFLSRRPRSTKEMRDYLLDKLVYHHPDYADLAAGVEREVFVEAQQVMVERIMERLRQQDYLDDVSFAKWWIDSRRQFRPRGKRLLLLELKAKGISDGDIAAALTTPSDAGHFVGEATEYDEVEAAARLAHKYVRKYLHLSLVEQKQRVSRYLAGKGYEWEVIEQVLEKLNG